MRGMQGDIGTGCGARRSGMLSRSGWRGVRGSARGERWLGGQRYSFSTFRGRLRLLPAGRRTTGSAWVCRPRTSRVLPCSGRLGSERRFRRASCPSNEDPRLRVLGSRLVRGHGAGSGGRAGHRRLFIVGALARLVPVYGAAMSVLASTCRFTINDPIISLNSDVLVATPTSRCSHLRPISSLYIPGHHQGGERATQLHKFQCRARYQGMGYVGTESVTPFLPWSRKVVPRAQLEDKCANYTRSPRGLHSQLMHSKRYRSPLNESPRNQPKLIKSIRYHLPQLQTPHPLHTSKRRANPQTNEEKASL